MRGDVIEMYLKHETICPLVALLRKVPGVYNQQYARAVTHITHLISHLPEDELEVICRIDEPDTEKVGEIPRVRVRGP